MTLTPTDPNIPRRLRVLRKRDDDVAGLLLGGAFVGACVLAGSPTKISRRAVLGLGWKKEKH